MVDFEKLRASKKKAKAVDPIEIFRRLPKPPGISDLYTSQAEVLTNWFSRRTEKDTVIKLHTGGGKTLTGLLIAQSTINETNEPALYLVPTNQLVNQTLTKARDLGISAVPYKTGAPLDDRFLNGTAIMVANYRALFNGRSKFGLRGSPDPKRVGIVILDDAHVAFSAVRDSFTMEIRKDKQAEAYKNLTGHFRLAFKDVGKIGTFDEVVSDTAFDVLEVPYWVWHEKLDVVHEVLKPLSEDFALTWPLLRDHLHLCHALISRSSFTITPFLPLMDAFPTFFEAPRRVFMSATIADDSEIVRTFGASKDLVQKSFTSRSLAGVSERMILIPEVMPFYFDVQRGIKALLPDVAKLGMGSVVLVHSRKAAEAWKDVATVAMTTDEVDTLVTALQQGTTHGPVVFANRYDGIDLPNNSCRVLVMDGLPWGTSDYENFRASALYGGASLTRMLAQRIEQGIGRGARGSGDYCAVILIGSDLSGWIAKDANFRFLTTATRAQLEMGIEISKEVKSIADLGKTIQRLLRRDQDWVEYHAETLAENVEDESLDNSRLEQAAAERKGFELWAYGDYEKAVARVTNFLDQRTDVDVQTRGWMLQLAARIADHWGSNERAQDLQREAYSLNRNLARPIALPPYRPLPELGTQERAIANQIPEYRVRRGLLRAFDDCASRLVAESSSNQFEKALVDLARFLGLSAERFDEGGEGPDVLWILPNKVGLVIEAKSRKKEKNALTKDEHGQLLVAGEWFNKHYPGFRCVRVSVHPKSKATKAAVAEASHALTFENLAALVSETRSMLTALCDSQLSGDDLTVECGRILRTTTLNADRLVSTYLIPFSE